MTDINDISKDILQNLSDYSNIIEEDFEKSKRKNANKLKRDIQENSPHRTGDYEKGWKLKKVRHGYIVHNSTDYQLTHLLEKGYMKRNGERKGGRPHIAPAEDKAIRNFLNEVERMIRG